MYLFSFVFNRIIFLTFFGFSVLTFSQNSNHSKYAMAGLTFASVSVTAPQTTSLKIVSGVKQGFFIATGKQWEITPFFSLDMRAKISQSGGKIANSTFFITQKFPDQLEKYRNATLKITIYQLGLETNIRHTIKNLCIYAGLEPSLIFYGNYTEKNIRILPSPIPSPPNNDNIIPPLQQKLNFNILSLRGQLGVSYKINNRFFTEISYHTDILKKYEYSIDKIRLQFQQNVFQIGLGYYFH